MNRTFFRGVAAAPLATVANDASNAMPAAAPQAPLPPDDARPGRADRAALRRSGWEPGHKAHAHFRTTGPVLGVDEGEPPST